MSRFCWPQIVRYERQRESSCPSSDGTCGVAATGGSSGIPYQVCRNQPTAAVRERPPEEAAYLRDRLGELREARYLGPHLTLPRGSRAQPSRSPATS
jgi:hypothetical protein